MPSSRVTPMYIILENENENGAFFRQRKHYTRSTSCAVRAIMVYYGGLAVCSVSVHFPVESHRAPRAAVCLHRLSGNIAAWRLPPELEMRYTVECVTIISRHLTL